MEKLELTDLEISPLLADWLYVLLGPEASIPIASQRKPVGDGACPDIRHHTCWSVKPQAEGNDWSAKEFYYCIRGCVIPELKCCLEPGAKRCK